jgi:hypothetical protein
MGKTRQAIIIKHSHLLQVHIYGHLVQCLDERKYISRNFDYVVPCRLHYASNSPAHRNFLISFQHETICGSVKQPTGNFKETENIISNSKSAIFSHWSDLQSCSQHTHSPAQHSSEYMYINYCTLYSTVTFDLTLHALFAIIVPLTFLKFLFIVFFL